MSRTIFVPSCSVKRTAGFPAVSGRARKAYLQRNLQRSSGAVAAQADHADQREKAQHDEPEHRKLLEQEMVQFLFEGKDVHIEGYTPPEKQ